MGVSVRLPGDATTSALLPAETGVSVRLPAAAADSVLEPAATAPRIRPPEGYSVVDGRRVVDGTSPGVVAERGVSVSGI